MRAQAMRHIKTKEGIEFDVPMDVDTTHPKNNNSENMFQAVVWSVPLLTLLLNYMFQ